MALELLAYVCFSEPSTSSRSHLQMGAYFEHTKLIIICSCTCTSQALALCTKLLQLHLAPPSCNQCLSDAMLGNKAQQMYVCREKGQVLPNLPCNCHRLLNSRGGDPGRDPSPTAESISAYSSPGASAEEEEIALQLPAPRRQRQVDIYVRDGQLCPLLHVPYWLSILAGLLRL